MSAAADSRQLFAAPEADGRPAGHITSLLLRNPTLDSALRQLHAIQHDVQFPCDPFQYYPFNRYLHVRNSLFSSDFVTQTMYAFSNSQCPQNVLQHCPPPFHQPNVQTGPGAHSASRTIGTGCFPGGKVAGVWR